jgi:hypothetical protein
LVDPRPARDGGQQALHVACGQPFAAMLTVGQIGPYPLDRTGKPALKGQGRTSGQGATSVTQSKTGKPVRFEITETTRQSLERWIADPEMLGLEYLWPRRLHHSPHLSTRQYARILRDWVTSIGLEASAYGTHSMRRTKVAQIYKKTGNLRAVQLLLGHTKMDSTVRYLGVDLDDALTLSEGIDL